MVAGLQDSPVSGNGPIEAVQHGCIGDSLGEHRPALLPDTRYWLVGKVMNRARDGEVTFEKELSSSSSYFQMRNLGTLVTSVTVTTIKS